MTSLPGEMVDAVAGLGLPPIHKDPFDTMLVAQAATPDTFLGQTLWHFSGRVPLIDR